MSLAIQRRSLTAALLFVLAFVCGCGSSTKKYTPAVDTAKTALKTALDKWKSGDAYGPVSGSSVPIDFQDSRWKVGKKLESYEILEEEKQEEGPKIINVKMKLTDDKEQMDMKYYIFGINPLHVWRDKDYAKNTGTG